jgi:hypothetical protein
LEEVKFPRSPGWPTSPSSERLTTPYAADSKVAFNAKWGMSNRLSGFTSNSVPNKKSARISGSSRPASSVSASPVVVGVRMHTQTRVDADPIFSRGLLNGVPGADPKGISAISQEAIRRNDLRSVSGTGVRASVGKVVRNGVERTLLIETNGVA